MSRVLVVDDAATVRSFVELSLMPHGHEVLGAADGCEGLARVDEDGPFDLIIVDLMMPRLNGFHFMEEVRSRLGDASPKMLVLTSEVSRLLLGQAKASGATGWISKPVEAAALVDAVRRMVPEATS